MEASSKRQEFSSLSVADLSSSPIPSPSTVTGLFDFDESGAPQLRFRKSDGQDSSTRIGLKIAQILKLSSVESLCVSEGSECKEKSFSRAFRIGFETEEESKAFHSAFEHWKHRMSADTGKPLENGSVLAPKSKFDDKIESSSAKMYFHYYGQLLHQQNMLQDYVRTGSYYAAVIENRVDFHGRVVVDVGAGSGILSLFAAQAGAKHVYAVEASEMAEYARRLIAGNPSLGQRITVIKGKVEEVELPDKADILISEPMGTLLVNERMLESYVIARDRFLLPNGKMFPTLGRIHMAPFSDEYLYVEIANKALFWQQQNYYGVDLTPLHGSAFKGYFSQHVVPASISWQDRRDRTSAEYSAMHVVPASISWQDRRDRTSAEYSAMPVVDAFDPRLLVSPAMFHTLDFTGMKEEELYEMDIPLNFTASVGTRVHGLACWFDVLFDGSSVQRWLTTAPGAPTTHWYQLRCILTQPLYVVAGQEITGNLRLVAHSAQSYTIYLTMSAKMWGPGAEQGGILQTSTGKLDLKEPYYRLSQPQPYVWTQDQQQQQQPMPSQGFSPQTLEEGDATILLQMSESPDNNLLNR